MPKSFNPKGRPKGSKDKSYLKLEFWYNELKKDWPKLRPAQRAKLSVQIMQMLVNKLKALPSDPIDSVSNAKDAQNLLNLLDGTFKSEALKNDLNGVVSPSTPPPPVVDSSDNTTGSGEEPRGGAGDSR